MFKKITILIVLLIAGTVSAQEQQDSYIRMEINETKVKGVVSFSLSKAELIYGNYEDYYLLFKESGKTIDISDYILETYDKDKNLLFKYLLYSAELGFSGNYQEKIISIIPYNNDNLAQFIKIDNNDQKTDFIALPSNLSSQLQPNNKTCKKENEIVGFGDKCCLGLIGKPTAEGELLCVNCGDNICSTNEDHFICSDDCNAPIVEESSSQKKSSDNPLPFIVAGALIGILSMAISIKLLSVFRKRMF